MCFSAEQIEAVLRENLDFNNFDNCTRINGGYSKYSYKIVVDKTPFVFQIMKNPNDITCLVNNQGSDLLYPGGIDNYLKSKDILDELNILIPRTIFYDSSKTIIEFDCALYEFIEYDSYTGFERHKKQNTLKKCLFDLGSSLGLLKNYKRNIPGDLSTRKYNFIPNKIVFDVSCDYLDVSLETPFIQNNKSKIKDTLEELNEKIAPRDSYYLIHSDFKPDNFRFDRNWYLYWIDFESLQYFDIEYEFSQFITPDFIITNNDDFKNGYFKDRKIDIDENRLKFYQIYRSVSQIVNCSNSMIIKDDKEPVKEIIESNIKTLKTLL